MISGARVHRHQSKRKRHARANQSRRLHRHRRLLGVRRRPLRAIHLRLLSGKRALAASRSLLKEHASSAWAHFLAGLAHSALEDRRDAIYSFVRAARRSDIEMHHVVMELARGLKISIELID